MHKRNLRFLAVKLFEVVNGLAPTVISEFILFKGDKPFFKIPKNVTVLNGFESIYLGPKICEMLPSEMQEYQTLNLKAK